MDSVLSETICCFGSTLVSETFACPHAEPVVRRGGSEIRCRQVKAHARCGEVFARLKQVALPVFEVEDDLTRMPHSVLQKIQYGGLLGLQQSTCGNNPGHIEDIDQLLQQAEEKYSAISSLPYGDAVASMIRFKLKRRRGRN